MTERKSSTPPHERRVHPRYEILAQVEIRRRAVTHVLEVRSISIGGAFISTTDRRVLAGIRLDEELELDIFATDELENLRVKARVVRLVGEGGSEAPGFGVRFEEVAADSQRLLERLVELAAAGRLRPPPLPKPRIVFAEPDS